MPQTFDKAFLQSLIDSAAEENTTLEYKGALSLSTKNAVEITKDVSAMANAMGGLLIYGIAEFREEEKRHLPAAIEAIPVSAIRKEWIDQILGTIRPKIENLRIHPVSIDETNGLHCYVIEIPQSRTIHQARDFKYYRRRNFENSPMEDYEVREALSRYVHPKLHAEIIVTYNTQYRDHRTFTDGIQDYYTFDIKVLNQGEVIANCFSVLLSITIPELDRGDYKYACVFPKEKCEEYEWRNRQNSSRMPLFPADQVTTTHKASVDESILLHRCGDNFTIAVTIFADGAKKKDYQLSVPVKRKIITR